MNTTTHSCVKETITFSKKSSYTFWLIGETSNRHTLNLGCLTQSTSSKDFSIRVIDPGILVSGWRSYLCMFASICDFTLYQMSPSGAHFLGSLSSYMKLSTPTALTSFPMTADIIVDPLYTPISK